MHNTAKRELIKKGLETADAIVTVFELDEKIDNIIGMPWKTKNKRLIISNKTEIDELTKKYNLTNKGDEIYNKLKKQEALENEKEKLNCSISVVFCITLFSFITYMLISFLLSI